MSVKAVRAALWSKLNGTTDVTTLLGDPAPGYSESIYDDVAPEGAKFPYIILSLNTGSDRYTHGQHAWEDDLWLVKAVDRNTTGNAADEIEAAVFAALNDAALTISGSSLMSIRRQTKVRYSDNDGGEQYRHSGGLYRIRYQ